MDKDRAAISVLKNTVTFDTPSALEAIDHAISAIRERALIRKAFGAWDGVPSKLINALNEWLINGDDAALRRLAGEEKDDE